MNVYEMTKTSILNALQDENRTPLGSYTTWSLKDDAMVPVDNHEMSKAVEIMDIDEDWTGDYWLVTVLNIKFESGEYKTVFVDTALAQILVWVVVQEVEMNVYEMTKTSILNALQDENRTPLGSYTTWSLEDDAMVPVDNHEMTKAVDIMDIDEDWSDDYWLADEEANDDCLLVTLLNIKFESGENRLVSVDTPLAKILPKL